MAFEQGSGFAIDEGIDLRRRTRRLQYGEHRRSKQDVTVMAQFGYQHPVHQIDVDGIRRRVVHLRKIPKRFVAYKRVHALASQGLLVEQAARLLCSRVIG